MKQIKNNIVIIIILVMAGCKAMEPSSMPAVKPMPQQFTGSENMSDTVKLDFARFFPDTQLQILIDSAMQYNTDLHIAWQRIAIAEARLSARKGALLPAVNAVVSGGAERYGDYTMNGVGNFDTNLSPNISKDQQIPLSPTTDLFVGLRSNWEIDIWGKLRHQRQAAAAELVATRAGRQLIITSLVARLSQGYYELLALDAELDIVKKNISVQEEGLEIVKAQKAGGRATELAVQQFAAQLLNTKAIQYRLLQDRIAVENEVNALAGQYPRTIPRASLPALSERAVVPVGLPAALLSRRPDIREAEFNLAAMQENVQAARAAFLPALTLNPYIGLNAFTPGLLFKGGSVAYGLLGGLTAPLFQQRSLKAQYTIANAGNREAVYKYQQRLLDAYAEVMTKISATQNYRQSYTVKKLEVQQLKEAVATARDLYLSGYANYLEVILAQKNVLEAELELMRQKRDIFVALVQLYRSLGGGWK